MSFLLKNPLRNWSKDFVNWLCVKWNDFQWVLMAEGKDIIIRAFCGRRWRWKVYWRKSRNVEPGDWLLGVCVCVMCVWETLLAFRSRSHIANDIRQIPASGSCRPFPTCLPYGWVAEAALRGMPDVMPPLPPPCHPDQYPSHNPLFENPHSKLYFYHNWWLWNSSRNHQVGQNAKGKTNLAKISWLKKEKYLKERK